MLKLQISEYRYMQLALDSIAEQSRIWHQKLENRSSMIIRQIVIVLE